MQMSNELDGESNIAEIIRDKLYFWAIPGSSTTGVQPPNAVFFTVDRALTYEPFYADFGPLNLGRLYRFCSIVETKLKEQEVIGKRLFLYTSRGPQKQANAGFLIGAYQVLVLKRSPAEAWATLSRLNCGFIPFRDASMQPCLYKLTILNCLESLQAAVNLKWFNLATFDIEQYEHDELLENGDMNMIVPDKFIHFSGPSNTHRDADGYPARIPSDYFDAFKRYGVTDIIRLNKKCYDKSKFTSQGFQHHELYFVDGSTPSMAILEKFIQICEEAKGMIAVHCKAGLGRTGTCVGCYMMKHYKMTAAQVIGWLRICRPGSVLGPQQFFLEDMQEIMWKIGEKHFADKKVVEDKKLNSFSALGKQFVNALALDAEKGPVTRSQSSKSTMDSPKESQGVQLIHQKFDAQRRHSIDQSSAQDGGIKVFEHDTDLMDHVIEEY